MLPLSSGVGGASGRVVLSVGPDCGDTGDSSVILAELEWGGHRQDKDRVAA